MDFLDLSNRDRQILHAVVQDYIRTAEPVGSGRISRNYPLEISPATIRSAMSSLEEKGLLMQPHKSAGRVPTDLGLRFYVDTILEIRSISGQDQQVIKQEFAGMQPEFEHIIKHSSKVLSSISKHMGIVLAPRFSSLKLRQLQFVRLSERVLLVILVGQSGMVQNRIIELEENVDQEDLNRFNNYLNDVLEGLTISEIKIKIVEEMRQEKNQFDEMFSKALELSRKVFDYDLEEDDIYLDGRVNLLESPEFADLETMKSIFRTFEDKSVLVKLLDRTLEATGVQIFIGSENEQAEMEGCTLIASRYSRGTIPLGTLGVIGPTRLNYSKIIPVVDYTAKFVSHLLEKNLK